MLQMIKKNLRQFHSHENPSSQEGNDDANKAKEDEEQAIELGHGG